jgi:nucleoside-triphosphatase
MEKIFLQGERFVGKSTLLKTIILEQRLSVTGFYVERWLDKQGRITGFELCDASNLGKLEAHPNSEHCFIQMKNGRRRQNIAVFETYGKFLIEVAQNIAADVILLDEIGGIELQSSLFQKALFQLIQQPRKIVGVYKSDQNFQTQKLPREVASFLLQKRKELYYTLTQYKGQIITLNQQNKEAVQQQLLQFLVG